MITLTLPRQKVEDLRNCFFPDINFYKQTRLHNVQGFSVISEEYLSAVVINCVLSEVEHLIKKKLITSTGRKIKFEFTDAQGIVLYKTLIALSIDPGQVYFNMVRNEIIMLLDTQIAQLKLSQSLKDSHSTV